MTDEPKTKTPVEELTVAEVVPPTSPEFASETTTVIAPVQPSNSEGTAPAADANESTGATGHESTGATGHESTGATGHESKAFDPYRFQRMTVPPGLRSEMAQVKLPRLSDEYFKETLPPATMKAAADSSEPAPETPDSREPVSNGGSDVPTVFEPIERTPTSLSLPLSSTPRTLFWGGLGLLVGVILLFIAREVTTDEPKLAMSPPGTEVTAPRGSATSGSLSVSPPPLPDQAAPLAAEIALPPALTAPEPVLSTDPPAPSAPRPSATAALPARPRKPSGPTSASSSAQSPAPNTKRLWITPR